MKRSLIRVRIPRLLLLLYRDLKQSSRTELFFGQEKKDSPRKGCQFRKGRVSRGLPADQIPDRDPAQIRDHPDHPAVVSEVPAEAPAVLRNL
ncbi:hypothetical protein HMPREF9374_1683 [Desmospora sp. 8437]|nr:hypothetical protein HMPREF9374_1683 [Desmospora sp. 8437]